MISLHSKWPTVQRPTPGSALAAGLDMYAHLLSETGQALTWTIARHTTRRIPTGLQNASTVMYFICSRSGLAMRSVFVANSPGIVDADFRGDVDVLLYNGSDEPHYVKHGDRIAQLVGPWREMGFNFSSKPLPPELIDTERGASGYGSTGR